MKKEDIRTKSGWKETTTIFFLAVLLASSVVMAYYTNAITNQIIQKVESINDSQNPANLELVEIVDNSCTECFNISQVSIALAKAGVNINQSKSLELSSDTAKDLVSKYNITRIPAVIISGELEKSKLVPALKSSGGRSVGDSIIMESLPPYLDIATEQIKGNVDVIFLNDSSCSSCYDVNLHKQVLARFGVSVKSESVYDVSSAKGKEFISKYNITKIPTVLLSPEADVYSGLKQIWQQVGTIENDGWYVFRTMEAIQGATYYDLSLNKIVNQTA